MGLMEKRVGMLEWPRLFGRLVTGGRSVIARRVRIWEDVWIARVSLSGTAHMVSNE